MDTMKDHRAHLNARLDAIQKGQNDITKSVQEMTASINNLLQAQRDKREDSKADYDSKIQDLCADFNHAMEKNVAAIQKGAMTMIKNRCDYHNEDESMSELSPTQGQSTPDHDSKAESSLNTHVSVTDFPYSNMAQFGATPANESLQLTVDGHHRQKRPIDDVTISGSG